MYYIAKLKWLQPKEDTDEMQKYNKSFLVNAVSVTDVEVKITEWKPSNYQDLEIVGVQESKLVDIITETSSEVYWECKLGDENEKGKLVPFVIAIDGANHLEVLKRVNQKYSMSEFLEMKKMKVIIDPDLLNTTKETVEESSEI